MDSDDQSQRTRSKRPAVPRAVREAVLKEFNHRCALCGADKPQVHHIDGDCTHNEKSNLIPLCPNCHLIDQHSPARPVDPAKLSLFRQYKDPAILSPQFHALYSRLLFLDDISDTCDTEKLRAKASELAEFVEMLQMGGFYSRRIRELTRYHTQASVWLLGDSRSEADHRACRDDEDREYRRQLCCVRDEITALAIELLRFQDWSPKADRG